MLKFALASLLIILFRYLFRDEERASKVAVGTGGDRFQLDTVLVEVLEQHFPYYATLDDARKSLFRKRLGYFIRAKRFIAREGFELSDPMKVLIGAEAIRISLGLKKFILPHFKVINVYPDVYWSRFTNGYHAGDVNLGGSISLAWTEFAGGLVNPNDGKNLALHEFAHALYFENFEANEDYLFMDGQALKEFERLAKKEMKEMEEQPDHFIRAYGSTNKEEFFAVSTEHFFEQPAEFREEHPEIYQLLTRIYNQDPGS